MFLNVNYDIKKILMPSYKDHKAYNLEQKYLVCMSREEFRSNWTNNSRAILFHAEQ